MIKIEGVRMNSLRVFAHLAGTVSHVLLHYLPQRALLVAGGIAVLASTEALRTSGFAATALFFAAVVVPWFLLDRVLWAGRGLIGVDELRARGPVSAAALLVGPPTAAWALAAWVVPSVTDAVVATGGWQGVLLGAGNLAHRCLLGLTGLVVEPHHTGVCAVRGGDRTHLAVSGRSSAVRVWDLGDRSGMVALRLRGPAVAVCAVPGGDGDLLAAAGYDHAVHLWDPATGEQRRIWRGRGGSVHALCAVGPLLATGDHRGAVVLYDVARGTRVRDLPGGRSPVRALCAVGPLLASGDGAGVVNLHDPSTGDLVRSFRHGAAVLALCALRGAGGPRLASAGADRAVRVWDPETGELERTVLGATVHDLAELAPGTLALAGDHWGVGVLGPDDDECALRHSSACGPTRGLVPVPGEPRVATVGWRHEGTEISLWELTG